MTRKKDSWRIVRIYNDGRKRTLYEKVPKSFAKQWVFNPLSAGVIKTKEGMKIEWHDDFEEDL